MTEYFIKFNVIIIIEYIIIIVLHTAHRRDLSLTRRAALQLETRALQTAAAAPVRRSRATRANALRGHRRRSEEAEEGGEQRGDVEGSRGNRSAGSSRFAEVIYFLAYL